MKFVETVTLDWQSSHEIELKTDFENCISYCVKNIRLIKPDGTPISFEIKFSQHKNLNETLYCEDFPVYRHFHGFKKIEHFPFALNKIGIYESFEILTNCETEFKGKIRYDIYEVHELNPKLPDEILITGYKPRLGKTIAFIKKNYKEESKPNQDETKPEPLQLTVGDETHILKYTRFIRKAINLTFFLYQIDEPEYYMDISPMEKLPENLFSFVIISTKPN